MKRKFFLAVVAISLRAACGQAAINTIVEAKITNSTPDLISYRSAFTRISFENLGLNGQRGVLTCDSARYVCTIRSVRDDCNEKRCLFGYSIFITKK
jgi:hypothetical protein